VNAFFCVPGLAFASRLCCRRGGPRGIGAVVERELPPSMRHSSWSRIARIALALGGAQFYGDPSESMQVIGLTGTNGRPPPRI